MELLHLRSIYDLGDALVILSSSAANAATGSFYFSGFILFSGFLLERVWPERSNCKRKTNELRVEQSENSWHFNDLCRNIVTYF